MTASSPLVQSEDAAHAGTARDADYDRNKFRGYIPRYSRMTSEASCVRLR